MIKRKIAMLLIAMTVTIPTSMALTTRAYAINHDMSDLGRMTGKTQQVSIKNVIGKNLEIDEGTTLTVPQPSNSEFNSGVSKFYGIRITRYGSDNLQATNLSDFNEKVIINGRDSQIYTLDDPHYVGGEFRFSYADSRINLFSGYWDFADKKNTAVINKGHRFRVRIDYLYKLTDGTEIIINGDSQEFREDLVVKPPQGKPEILTSENKPIPIIQNVYNSKEHTNIWLNKPIRIRVTPTSRKYPIRRVKYWLYHKDVGTYNNNFISMSDNKTYESQQMNNYVNQFNHHREGYMKYATNTISEGVTEVNNILGESFYSNDSTELTQMLHTCMEMRGSGYYVVLTCAEDFAGNYSPITATEISFDDKPSVFNQVVFNPLSKTDIHLRAYINGDDNFAGITKLRYKYWNVGSKEPNYDIKNVVNYTVGTQPYSQTEIKNMTEEQKDSLLNVQNFYGFNVPYPKTSGNIYVKLQLIDKSGNLSDEKLIEVPQNSKPEIKIDDKDKEIRVGANSFIQFKGKVKDVDKNQMLRINCDFIDNAMLPNRKTRKLNVFSDGTWQPFSYLFNTNDLEEGLYKQGVKFTVTDTCDDKSEVKYEGKIMIDKTAPKTLTQPKLVNISKDDNYQVYKFQYYDNLSGLNTVESNFGNTYKIEPYNGKFEGNDVKLYCAGNFEDRYITYYLYVPKEKKEEVPSVLTFTAKDTVGNTSVTNFTITTRGIDSDDAQDFQLKTDINTDLRFMNYKEEMPQLHLRAKESDVGLYHTVIVPAKTVSQTFKMMSSKYKDLQVLVKLNGQQVFNQNINDVNGMCQEHKLDLDLKPNQYNRLDVIYTDSVGNVVKKDFYNIRIADDFPMYWNWRTHGMNLNMFNGLETNFPKPSSDLRVYLSNEFNTSLYSFEGKFYPYDRAIDCLNRANASKVEDFLRKNSIVTYSFFNNDGNRIKGDYTINMTNTKPTINISLNDNQVMQTISLFGYNFMHNSKFIQHLYNDSSLYACKKDSGNFDKFKCTTTEQAINVTGGNKVSSDMSYALPSTGEYLLASEFNILNKHVDNFNILSYVSDVDRATLMNVENSSRFLYNDNVLYDVVSKKAIALNLGAYTKAKQFQDKLYLYSDKGILVYDFKMNLIASKNTRCGGVDIYKEKVYVATSEGIVYGDNLKKVAINGNYHFIQNVNDNLLIGSNNTVTNYNFNSPAQSNKKQVNKLVCGAYVDDNKDLTLVYIDGTSELFIQP